MDSLLTTSYRFPHGFIWSAIPHSIWWGSPGMAPRKVLFAVGLHCVLSGAAPWVDGERERRGHHEHPNDSFGFGLAMKPSWTDDFDLFDQPFTTKHWTSYAIHHWCCWFRAPQSSWLGFDPGCVNLQGGTPWVWSEDSPLNCGHLWLPLVNYG